MKYTSLVLLIGLAAAGAASAAPIYRCGPDGRIYSQTPCADGTIIEATDPRTAAQRAEAKRIVEADRRAAAELERERRAAEKATTTPVAANLSPVAATPAASAPAAAQKKPAGKTAAKPGKDFVAVAPKAASAAR